MFIIEKPYVSEYMIDSIINHDWPVLDNETIEDSGLEDGVLDLWSTEEATEYYLKQEFPLIYSNSENALAWIVENLPESNLTKYIKIFKDKIKFREILKEKYPDFYYKSFEYLDINYVEREEFQFPLILKPSVGYLSFGVHLINELDDWENEVKQLNKEIATSKNKYNENVVNSKMILAEQVMKGEELAVDAYYDRNGTPVVLNIFKHLYKDEKDISDRLYITSAPIMSSNLTKVTEFLTDLGQMFNIKNFPLHLEIKINEAGVITPMEVNPMRFAGWCTSDIAKYAWGFNVYEYFEEQKHPDWSEILQNSGSEIYYFSFVDIPAGFPKSTVRDFNFSAYLADFSNVFEVRRINFKSNPFFGVIFGSTTDEEELDMILNKEPAAFAV